MFLFRYIKRLFCDHLEVINNKAVQGQWNTAQCKNCNKNIKLFTIYTGKF